MNNWIYRLTNAIQNRYELINTIFLYIDVTLMWSNFKYMDVIYIYIFIYIFIYIYIYMCVCVYI